MKKNSLSLFAFLLVCGCCVAAIAQENKNFGVFPLKGGTLQPIDMTMVESSNEHINFCFGNNYSDGSIYIGHSKGIHTVTEYGHKDVSYDNGRTCQESKYNFGFNSYELADGTKCSIGCWDPKCSTEHVISRSMLKPGAKEPVSMQCTITLDRPSSFRLHRDVVRCRSGRLLLTGYGMWENDPKFHSFVIASDDDGETWFYLSTIMDDPERKYVEGPNECAVMELANGELLAMVRVHATVGMFQLRSTDGGKSWNNEGQVRTYAAAPAMRMTHDGILLVISGRPGVYLLIDFTGTGREWQEVPIYTGSGSSYASVLETEPGILTILHDESDFGSWRTQTMFSRLMCSRFRLTPKEGAEETAGDAKQDGWDAYYSAAMGMPPSENRMAAGGYRTKDKAAKAYYEFITTEMRSHQLLRLVNLGEDFAEKFLNYSAPLPRGANSFSIRCECRLVDNSQNGPQLGLVGVVDDLEKGTDAQGVVHSLVAWIGVQKDGILYNERGTYKLHEYPIDLTFHEVRLSADAKSRKGEVYVDDLSKPLFTFDMLESVQNSPKVQIGDGATNVYGVCDIVNFAWNFSKKDFSAEAAAKTAE